MVLTHTAVKSPGDTGYASEWNAIHSGALPLSQLEAGTKGDIIYFNGTNWVSLPAGTAGDLLQTNGAGFNPSWITYAVGGAIGDRCLVYKSANVSYSSGSYQTVNFDSEVYDNNDMHDNITNNERITIIEEGYYLIFGQVAWQSGVQVGSRGFLINDNSGNRLVWNEQPASTSAYCNVFTGATVRYLSAGQYIYMQALQSSGGNLELRGGDAGQTFMLAIQLNAVGVDALPAGVQGDIIYHNGSNWVVLTAGTNGYVLTTQGSGNNPIWATHGIAKHTDLTDKEVAGVIDHADSSVTSAKLNIDDDVNWNSNNIDSVGAITAGTITTTNISGTVGIIFSDSDLDFATSKRVINMQDPINLQDAATKNYVDTNFEPVISKGNLTAASPKITIGGSPTNSLIGTGASVDVNEANLTLNNIGGTLSVSKGGTNLSTYTIGDILYASASTTLSKRGVGSAGQVLTVSGGVPTWQNPTTGVTDHALLSNLDYASSLHTGFEPTITLLGETKGGTGQNAYTTGDILYSDASNSLNKRGIGSPGQVLTVSGGVPTWQTPSTVITKHTDLTDKEVAGVIDHADSSITEPKLAMNNSPTNGYIIAWNSGSGGYMEWITAPATGVTSVASGNGMNFTTITTTGTVTMGTPSTCTNVTTNATTATSHTHEITGFLTSVSGQNHSSLNQLDYASAGHTGFEPTITTLGETRGGTGESTYTTGDILYSDAANSLAKRGIGTSGQVLTVSGGVPTWQSIGGGAGGVPLVSYSATDSDTATSSMTFVDLVSLSHNSVTGKVLIIFTGDFRSEMEIQLVKDGSPVTGTIRYFASSTTYRGELSTSAYDSSAGNNTWKIQFRSIDGASRNCYSYSFTIMDLPGNAFYYHTISDATTYDLATSTKITWLTIHDYGNLTATSVNSLLNTHYTSVDIKMDFGPDASKARMLITANDTGFTYDYEQAFAINTSWQSYTWNDVIGTLSDSTTYNVKMQMWMPNTSTSNTYHVRNLVNKTYFLDGASSV